jgi:uncharacterized membrane protein
MLRKLRRTRTSAWMIPLIYAAVATTYALTMPRLWYFLFPHLSSTISVDAAIAIYSSVASGMMALTSIVFSLTFLMVQFSATAYSPRLVIWISRDPVVSHALGVLLPPSVYALAALAWVYRVGSRRVPLMSIVAVVGMIIAIVFMFISLIRRVAMLQVNRVLIFVGNKGREVIENLYPPIAATGEHHS